MGFNNAKYSGVWFNYDEFKSIGRREADHLVVWLAEHSQSATCTQIPEGTTSGKQTVPISTKRDLVRLISSAIEL
ncbi:MAG: hypothetical protein DMF69_14460 [Acidobacteria bacterium]|nr:MAG: hypothetical protein DMF69_14460 [Acidobacteriota bacterium]